MRPTPAEVARTLVRGRLPGALRFEDGLAVTGVQHAADRLGRPLLLVPAGEELATRLRGRETPRVALAVDDVPPRFGAPSLGRVRVVGDLHPVPEAEISDAVLEYAESVADPDLFDVGDGIALHRLVPARVTLNRGGVIDSIDLDAYAAAEPDPLQECEEDLLADLAHHHLPQLADYLSRLLGEAAAFADGPPQAMRLDRYGLVVDLGEHSAAHGRSRWVRLEFARAVTGQHDLAHLMHPILCARRCGGRE
ncbi:DUF2470 domain-containing protein [Glycomyces terrestris]|uniref:DUF2470 domain-containing protein n=1 Tax=Glycomyces terrestris TaxID=2493553 RepID=A0A426V0M9_9ACTN|nr:DUF2470 domain-containing protein [Glycomyces terrestris]RRS00414.1 DUF2470 domain-containing protein [Glycomyces terrestris]